MKTCRSPEALLKQGYSYYVSAERHWKEVQNDYQRLLDSYNLIKTQGRDITGLPKRVYKKADAWKRRATKRYNELKGYHNSLLEKRANMIYWYNKIQPKDDRYHGYCFKHKKERSKIKHWRGKLKWERKKMKGDHAKDIDNFANKMAGEGGRFRKFISKLNLVALAPVRGIITFLTKKNFVGLAKRLYDAKQTDHAKYKQVMHKWEVFGGKESKFLDKINKGKNKPSIDTIKEFKLLFKRSADGNSSIVQEILSEVKQEVKITEQEIEKKDVITSAIAVKSKERKLKLEEDDLLLDARILQSDKKDLINSGGDRTQVEQDLAELQQAEIELSKAHKKLVKEKANLINEKTKNNIRLSYVFNADGDMSDEEIDKMIAETQQQLAEMSSQNLNQSQNQDASGTGWKAKAIAISSSACTIAGTALGATVLGIGAGAGAGIGGAAGGLLSTIISILPDKMKNTGSSLDNNESYNKFLSRDDNYDGTTKKQWIKGISNGVVIGGGIFIILASSILIIFRKQIFNKQ